MFITICLGVLHVIIKIYLGFYPHKTDLPIQVCTCKVFFFFSFCDFICKFYSNLLLIIIIQPTLTLTDEYKNLWYLAKKRY